MASKPAKINKYIRNIRPPYLQQNGHLQTIVPSLLRKVNNISYSRERISTPDGDFLDLDWALGERDNLALICHGLEGNASRAYVKGMARYFHSRQWSVLAMNFRGCSEEINRKERFYHSGSTEDLDTVIEHVLNRSHFKKIHLIGFSLGGNLILKYLGEQGEAISDSVIRAICFSVPLDLHQTCINISTGINRIYSTRFLKLLKRKVLRKSKLYPSLFDLKSLKKIDRLIDFDDQITAPLHGFKDALDYYNQCSAINFLDRISIPALIVNAENDPLLSDSCFPAEALHIHPYVKLLVPSNGGHCGFADRTIHGEYWSEVLAWKYLNMED